MLRWPFFLALSALVTYLLWLPDVRLLVQQNPTHTALMQLREDQARQAGQQPHSVMHWRSLDDISPNLIHAVITSEDDTFYEHGGFDLEQIQVAVQRDWQKRHFVYGGSTITQQLARTLYLSPRKNLFRKAKEAMITI